MPKARPKTTKKKTTAKAKTMPKAAPKSALHKPYLAKEQEDFHKQHPNADLLIKILIVLTILMAGLYYAKFGFALMP